MLLESCKHCRHTHGQLNIHIRLEILLNLVDFECLALAQVLTIGLARMGFRSDHESCASRRSGSTGLIQSRFRVWVSPELPLEVAGLLGLGLVGPIYTLCYKFRLLGPFYIGSGPLQYRI